MFDVDVYANFDGATGRPPDLSTYGSAVTLPGTSEGIGRGHAEASLVGANSEGQVSGRPPEPCEPCPSLLSCGELRDAVALGGVLGTHPGCQ